MKFRALGVVSILTGVAKAAGHEPREPDDMLKLPICKIDLRGFPMKKGMIHLCDTSIQNENAGDNFIFNA
jgi:hypothetical protein